MGKRQDNQEAWEEYEREQEEDRQELEDMLHDIFGGEDDCW
jgi:hypothetical protein